MGLGPLVGRKSRGTSSFSTASFGASSLDKSDKDLLDVALLLWSGTTRASQLQRVSLRVVDFVLFWLSIKTFTGQFVD